MKTLRPHQTKAVALLRESIRTKHKRPILALHTGSGKTFIAATIIKSAIEKGKRILFVCDAIELIDQTVAAFYAADLYGIGVIQAQHPLTDYSKQIQVASIQTLGRRKCPPFDLCIIDEVHSLHSAHRKLIEDNPETPFIGLSATPWTKGLGLVFDDLIQPASIAELTELGYVARLKAYAPGHPDLANVPIKAGEYDETTTSQIMRGEKIVANIVETWKALGQNRPTFCFCVDLAHAEAMRQRFEDAGIPAGYIDGKTLPLDRKAVKRQLDEGEIKIVCSVGTMIKGVDWVVGCVIDAQPTKSLMRHVQKLGRMRPNPQWAEAIVLDHSDNLLRLGLPIDININTLDTSKKGEKSTADQAAETVRQPKECPQCHVVAPKTDRRCTNCGYEGKRFSEIEEGAGELREVGGKTSGPKKGEPTYAERQAFFSELLGYAKKAGKSEGWAAHTYRDKFKAWPDGLHHFPAAPSAETQRYIQAKNIRWAKGQQKRKAA